ncbi:hypothetical protein [Streptomyces sp. NPDC101237]|uniref:hypothetical protein n=1 Tax=Streptomyces sp. NPDC101237 TaxID=3366139 RepID=UPI0038211361
MRRIRATIGVAVPVAVLGSPVDATSHHDFRVAWYTAAALSLVTSAVGAQLGRGRGQGPDRTGPAAPKGAEATVRALPQAP